jgi:hypothetical protein
LGVVQLQEFDVRGRVKMEGVLKENLKSTVLVNP